MNVMTKKIKQNEGFTLIEIIAVLVILGILAVVAIPKYLDISDTARSKAAMGQIAEVKGRLSIALADYMMENDGAKPTHEQLIDRVNEDGKVRCPDGAAAEEGDFWFMCEAADTAQTVTITVTKVKDVALTSAVDDNYTFAD